MLAVSDPAADVTSTQTWQAIGDGRATGVWTMPDRQVPGAAATGSGPAGQGSGLASPPAPGLTAPGLAAPGLTGSGLAAPGLPGPAGQEPVIPIPGGPGSGSAGSKTGRASRESGRRGRGRGEPDGDRTGASPPRSQALGPAVAGPGASPAVAGPGASPAVAARRAAGGHSGAHSGPHQVQRQRKSGRPASVKVAVTCAIVLVLAAAAALSYAVLRSSPKPKPAAPPVSKPTAAPSPSPTLGPYGEIGSRTSDPVPLTAAQLYPASYSSGGGTVVLTASKKNTKCSAEISGSALQSAVTKAGCNEVVRATYLAASQDLMGTIGVFNLSTAAGATKAVKAADAADFVSQLAAKHGKTAKIGQGTGIEEAAAKGHYLILIWAELTSLHKPKTAGQRSKIETFMTDLLDKTANVSLANRMVSGTP